MRVDRSLLSTGGIESRRAGTIALTILLIAYLSIATLYAALTPAWQVPDEPAHYNYVRSLAEGEGLPVLAEEDYDQAYLRRLTSEGFPEELSVGSLTYEDHQPPLYYLVATPIYVIFDGALLPLRLVSVVLGTALLIIAFSAVATIFPKRRALGLMAAAFVAFIPQHVAMTAGVNNDTLAEFVVAGTLWALVRYLDKRHPKPWSVGILLGTALLSKTTAYVVVGVAATAVLMRTCREGRTTRWALGQMGWMFGPALLLSAPWFVRNGLTYGWSDPLGLARHAAVVQGQPRTSEWLVAHGWLGLLTRLGRTTFHSFWGQFGWMAVPLPARFYRGLAVLSALLGAGFLARVIRCRRATRGRPLMVHRCLLLALSALLTVSAFVWYNLTFVQHQGRYLFPALVPLATAASLGLETLTDAFPRRLDAGVRVAFFVGLAVFDVYCLFRIILPNL